LSGTSKKILKYTENESNENLSNEILREHTKNNEENIVAKENVDFQNLMSQNSREIEQESE
jgi:hypothetical protein